MITQKSASNPGWYTPVFSGNPGFFWHTYWSAPSLSTFLPSRGVTRLDIAWGKKQIRRPPISGPGEMCSLSPLVTPLLPSQGNLRPPQTKSFEQRTEMIFDHKLSNISVAVVRGQNRPLT